MIISGKAKLAGVMGWPITHTLSPRLHGFWLERYGIDGAYLPLAVAPENFTEALRLLPKLGFAGGNVTVPHKERAFGAMDEVDDNARRMGAVNTVVVRADRSLFGTNTDGFGFMENLRQGCPGFSAPRGPAVVLGAGGAARAVSLALMDAGAPEIRMVNRTRARAEAVAADLGDGLSVWDWDDRAAALEGASLLVNTTTLGMTGHPALEISLDALPQGALVTDIVYVPLDTPLLAAARRRGHAVVDGLGMLLHQARPGFAAWFGHEPEVTEELRAFVLEGLGIKEPAR